MLILVPYAVVVATFLLVWLDFLPPRLSQFRAVLAAIFPDAWIFSERADADRVGINYMITLGIAFIVLMAGFVFARRIVRLVLTDHRVSAWTSIFALTVVRIVVLSGALLCLMAGRQLANRNLLQMSGQNYSGGQSWPWLVGAASILLVAAMSATRAVRTSQ